MKKFTATRICTTSTFLLCIAFLISTSCQDPDLINDLNIKENTQEVRLAQEALRNYASAISPVISELEFRTNVYNTIEEKFDGESNVLFKTLLDESKNPNYAKKLNSNLARVSSTGFNPFINLDGNNYFPQIYIPFFDELKANGKLGKEAPRIVIYTIDSSNSTYQSYRIDKQENLIEDVLVSEQFAKENEVWVLSINERVDDNGIVLDGYKSIAGRTQGVAYPNARFSTIKIDSHKEEWVAGASEVHIKRYLSFYRYDQYSSNPAAKNVTTEDALSDGDGWRIREVKRSDVGKTLTVNWNYVGDWPNQYYNFQDGSSYHTDYFYYVVFEYDAWPTGMRTATIPDVGLSGFTINTSYRSADTFYKQGSIPEYGANYWTSTSGFHFTSEF